MNPSKEQIDHHNKWKAESQRKSAKSLQDNRPTYKKASRYNKDGRSNSGRIQAKENAFIDNERIKCNVKWCKNIIDKSQARSDHIARAGDLPEYTDNLENYSINCGDHGYWDWIQVDGKQYKTPTLLRIFYLNRDLSHVNIENLPAWKWVAIKQKSFIESDIVESEKMDLKRLISIYGSKLRYKQCLDLMDKING